MAYMALYRKWRPKDFSDLIGQEHISKTLSNAITSGKIAHAYLFSGPRGTGKTSTAKILAKALNCEHGPTPFPCNECECCKKINDGSFMDVFEIDAASNRGIDEIRDLRETVKFAPVDGRYKVYIIDEVHMLTTEAFNALLKTLEEPPEHVVFILATTEVHKVPVTIQSRCQRYDFKRITKEDILARLEKITGEMNLKVDTEALEIIAIQADGGMRDALSLLDQCLAFTQNELTVDEVKKVLGLVGHQWIWQITDAIIAKNSQDILQIISEVIAQGKEIKQLLNEFILHLRSVMIYKATGKLLNMDMYFEDEATLQKQANAFSHDDIMNMIRSVHEAINEVKWANQPRITAEMLFLKLCWHEQDEQTSTPQMPQTQVSPVMPMQSNPADTAKITRMEQTIARLDRIVKALSTQVAKLNEAKVQMPARTFNPAPVQADNSAPPAVEPTPVQTSLRNEDAAMIWQNVLSGLSARGKKVVVACVNRAIPYQVNDNQFFIHFENSPFLQARTEKDDYRTLIESVLFDVTGHKLRLMCTGGDKQEMAKPAVHVQPKQIAPIPQAQPKVVYKQATPSAPIKSQAPAVYPEPKDDYQADIPMPTDDDYIDDNDVVNADDIANNLPNKENANSNVDYADMTPEGRHTLEKALEIFGGKIVPEDEK